MSLTSTSTPLSLADSPSSGLGDRLSAWLNLFVVARLNQRQAVLNRKAWSNHTHSGEAAQARDVINALECLILPPHVLRDQDVPSKPIYIRKVFAPGVPGLLPHPSPGFPQWALPELAVNGFRFSQLTPPNTSLLQYLVTMRSVMSELDVKPSCVPPNVPSELDFTTSAATRRVRIPSDTGHS